MTTPRCAERYLLYMTIPPSLRVVAQAATTLFLLGSGPGAAADWNPQLNWTDSYSVDGACYCDSSNFDHGLDEKQADTSIGRLNVQRICADIHAALGEGSASGRVPYNDIQCGNGPANDAPDEAGCPGRVDVGPGGCSMIGPRWNLDAVYGPAVPMNAPPAAPPDSTGPDGRSDSVALARKDWLADASVNAAGAYAAIDGDPATRWTTDVAQRIGQRFALDLGAVQRVNGLVLTSSAWPNDHPRRFVIWTSLDGQTWLPLRSGRTSSAPLTLAFEPMHARHLRIDQIGHDDFHWWSIGEVKVFTPR